MASHHPSKTSEPVWDGRFGKKFDDEISSSAVTWSMLATAIVTVIAMILMYGFFHLIMDNAHEDISKPLSMAVGEPMSPPLPRLQAKPEAEYRAYEAQVTHDLESYGWVDQAAGVAHIPIDDAMTLLVERGLPVATPPVAAEEDEDAEGATSS